MTLHIWQIETQASDNPVRLTYNLPVTRGGSKTVLPHQQLCLRINSPDVSLQRTPAHRSVLLNPPRDPAAYLMSLTLPFRPNLTRLPERLFGGVGRRINEV